MIIVVKNHHLILSIAGFKVYSKKVGEKWNLKVFYAKMQDGSVLYYEKIGKGKPLFLLHGNGGSSAYFC